MNIITTRRIIFVLVFIILAFGVMFSDKIIPKKLVTSPVKSIYDFIEESSPDDVVLLSLNYSPGSDAELTPMTKALTRHLFTKNVKFVYFTFDQRGLTLVSNTVNEVAKEMNKERNKDFVSLGFIPQPTNAIILMGTNFKRLVPKTEDGVPLDEVDFLKNIKTLSNFRLVIDITPAGTIDGWWIPLGVELYRIKLAGGCTGVMGTDYYPYTQTGQLVGIMAGVTGAFQYEALIKNPDLAYKRMVPQLFIHVFIIIIILLGNAQYLYKKRR